ncbi:TetR family transcriptional regulator [Microbacterium koreense]|uniref:TetR family transcriptional regulator n=1 Tax=Microbacterium koreense TaxID=323761 RepID=A0ABW2ZSW1_9MICO
MNTDSRAGRPRASSQETLADAACELFLEQGFDATSIADITRRAGVSRSSFFNYFTSKSDVLWAGLDHRIEALESSLASTRDAPDIQVAGAVQDLAHDFIPDPLALAIVNAVAMRLEDELARDAAVRRARIGRAVEACYQRAGADRIAAEVAGAAWGGAVLSGVEAWARDGAGRTSLAGFLERAAAIAARTSPTTPVGDVRQMRVVVQAHAFEQVLSFYRDGAGMPQVAAYEADGGARVAILEAGRATLEIANPEQVAFIDAVETDGDSPSEPIRIAFEVGDTEAAAARLDEAGAQIEADARVTPWRSRNARLRGPGGVQLTLFQELGPE